jgi:hypothetical protein
MDACLDSSESGMSPNWMSLRPLTLIAHEVSLFKISSPLQSCRARCLRDGRS